MSTALYRRYRPDTFADVIGQEHVTTPLMTALSKDRVNHAYLFSGPRGCGKTTSARILARCLNCAQGPTPTPCGTCDSCVELASGGSGSLDVIEIDAASHGGVEDARDLRERATFAPARDRFKVFIIDEAHMVTSAGFNALLKIVEEPPPHIKFIFATTEPDKVIGTIRSRTHHYPFRLVPPEALLEYLKSLCERENVQVADGVLPLVIRAGGGSVRDTLSVLDQLMAGATSGGVDYETAISLLGYTHATLLDEVALALHEGDGASLFSAIDRIVQTGLDPRRFVEDLLERFRDLIIAKAVPEGLEKILRGMPSDQLQSLADQAALFGSAELSRWADVTNQALTEMTGATSPRLHLELLAARLLLPAADNGASSLAARIDRLERHAMTGGALPELPDDQETAPTAGGYRPSPEANRQGAAAVREALAAARARKQGEAVDSEPAPQSASEPQDGQEPAAQPTPQTAQAQAHAEPPRGVQPEPETDPLETSGTLNTGPDADWGATWGPIDDVPSNPVTTPVNPAPSVPAERPDGVPPFSLVPDPNSGEDLSFGTGVPIDDVKQNAAMAEFTKRAAAQRSQQQPPAPQQQPAGPSQGQGPSQPGADTQQTAQREATEQQRQAEENARREQAQREEAARREAAQREETQRAEQQRQAEENARREQAHREEAARREEAQREEAQRAEQERQVAEAARREALQRRQAMEQSQQQRQAPAQQQAQQQVRQRPGSGPSPAAAPAGGAVQAFQQAWPTILEQLQASSRVLHSMVANYASIGGFDGRTLTLAFSNSGPLVNLRNRPDMMGLLTSTISQVMRQQVEVVLTEGGSGPTGGGYPKGERRPQPASAPVAERHQNAAADAPAPSSVFPAPGASKAPLPQAHPETVPTASIGSSDEPPYPDEPPFDPYVDAYPPEDHDMAASRLRPATTPIPEPGPASREEPAAPLGPSIAMSTPRMPRSFDGPPIAPPPRMTAGMAARQEEEGGLPTSPGEQPGTFNRPVSEVPLRPGSTTESFPDRVQPITETPIPPVTSQRRPQDGPRPDQRQVDTTAPVTAWGEPLDTQPTPVTPAESPASGPDSGRSPAAGQRLSRYQQLMNQSKGTSAAPVETTGGSWGQPQSSVPQRSTPQPAPEPEEFVPSDDDIAVEDSALIGVPAIERLLGGMVIEQRDANGNVVEVRRSL